MRSWQWLLVVLVLSLFGLAAVGVCLAEGTDWYNIISELSGNVKGGYGGSLVDVFVLGVFKTALLWSTLFYLLCASPLPYAARQSRLYSVRYAWVTIAVLYQTYLASKCVVRLINGPGDTAAPSAWFWGAVVSSSILCYIESYLIVHNVAKNEIKYAAKRSDSESAPLLASKEECYQAIQEEKQGANKKASLAGLMELSAPDTPLLLVAFVCLVVAAVALALIPHLTGQIIDQVAIHNDQEAFVRNTLYLLLASAVAAVFTGIRGSIFILTIARMNVRVRMMLMESLMKQEIGFFDTSRSGDITSRLNADTTKMSDQIGLNLNVFLRSIVQSVGVMLFMLYLSWKLTLVTLVSIPLVIALTKVFGEYYRQISETSQEQLGKANSFAQEALSAMATVRAHAGERSELKQYQHGLHDFYTTSERKALVYTLYSMGFTLLPNLVTALVLFYGGKLVIAKEMSGGGLVSFMLYQQSLSGAFNNVADVFTGMAEALGAADKVFQMINRETQISSDGVYKGDVTFKGQISLENVTFRYPARPEVTVLDGLNLAIYPGEVVALVGPSGGGKSSIVNLIERFYEPDIGRVAIDNVDVGEYDHNFLHSKIALVGQEPVLFARTIRDNIIYGLQGTSQEPTFDEVQQAAKLASAHDFIMSMPKGYDTEVGEKGVQLSGGQKQRIAIARELVRKPTVLLLDEATSALDAESEAVVQSALDNIVADRLCTVVVIAHRLSTVRSADRIVVLSQGHVVEEGRHEDLLARDGLYSRLVQRQLQGNIE
eukprot:comp21636_c0_seq1/m.30395 comp21636_c0_seq1/g.30395  ORF comp21636_c0_seq1/g.30395 comp21636_c0_seq1/m.30395 type:complete len:772 (-) comp21636_c0_seq1:303-2618(-)